nr:SIR2 family protein [Alkalibaculum sporogenes]
MIGTLKRQGLINKIILITTNYDLLIDSAILNNNINVDYGFKNFYRNNNNISLPLYKIYGSLNWKYCDVCDEFIISSGETLNRLSENFSCNTCNNLFKSIIVPPTFYKEISNYYLNNIYHNVNKSLYEVDNIIFCGYSFPDADLYIKFIIKRAEMYKQRPFRVKIINNYEGKSIEKIEIEKKKYELFFNGEVIYEKISFQEFSRVPQQYI